MKKLVGLVFLVSLMASSAFAVDVANGAKIYKKKCVTCHGKSGLGKKSQKAPRLAGQFDWYIETQVNLIIQKKRTSGNVKKMVPFVKKLKPSEVKDIAAYISQMK